MSETIILLECVKTGRFWRCTDYAAAAVEAARQGLVDYTMTPERKVKQ